MNAQNQAKLRREIAAAGKAVVARNGYVRPLDALLATGWLRPEKVEDWRRPGPRDRHRLRFSKSGDPNIERAYRTHWLPPRTNGTNAGA
jgi:hypothetical protein